MSETPTHKNCSICNERKPLSDFHRRPSARLGVRPECRSCRGRGAPEGKRGCIGCKSVLDLCDFDQRGDGSVSRYCLRCRPASRRILHPKIPLDAQCAAGEKQCQACLQVKPLAEYYVAHSAKDGRWGRCIVCESARKGREPVAPMGPEEKEHLSQVKDRRGGMAAFFLAALKAARES